VNYANCTNDRELFVWIHVMRCRSSIDSREWGPVLLTFCAHHSSFDREDISKWRQ